MTPANPASDLDLPRKQARRLPKSLSPEEIDGLFSLPNTADPLGVRRCPCIDDDKAILSDHRHFTNIGDHASPLLESSLRG